MLVFVLCGYERKGEIFRAFCGAIVSGGQANAISLTKIFNLILMFFL